jgi:hypothetical protein
MSKIHSILFQRYPSIVNSSLHEMINILIIKCPQNRYVTNQRWLQGSLANQTRKFESQSLHRYVKVCDDRCYVNGVIGHHEDCPNFGVITYYHFELSEILMKFQERGSVVNRITNAMANLSLFLLLVIAVILTPCIALNISIHMRY